MHVPARHIVLAPQRSLISRGTGRAIAGRDFSETEIGVDSVCGKPQRVVYPCHGARVKIRRPKTPRFSRAYEVGKFLTEEELRLAAGYGA